MQEQELGELKRLFPGVTVCSRLTEDELQELKSRHRAFPDALPRSTVNSSLLASWADFLVPHFGNGQACNLTGTYSDEYGYSHGLMLARNVIKDFQAFRRSVGRSAVPACIGVEYHPSTHRAILHFHAVIGGDWSDSDLRFAQSEWVATRGWCVAKHVEGREGCVRYAAKHLLKQGSSECLEFWLKPSAYGSRYERRHSELRVSDR